MPTEKAKPEKSKAVKNVLGARTTQEAVCALHNQVRNVEQQVWSGDEPEMPNYLCEVAAAEWRYIVNWLKAQNRLVGVERTLLAQYCITYALWVEAIEYLNVHGVIYINEHQFQAVTPWEGKREKYATELRAIMTNLLMTPQSRAAAEKSKTDDKPKTKTKAQGYLS